MKTGTENTITKGNTTPIQETEKCHFCGKPAPNFPGGCVPMCDECLKEPIQETWQEEFDKEFSFISDSKTSSIFWTTINDYGEWDSIKIEKTIFPLLKAFITSLLQRKEREVNRDEFFSIYNIGVRDGSNKRMDSVGAWKEYQASKELIKEINDLQALSTKNLLKVK